jgi:hypothetical protein
MREGGARSDVDQIGVEGAEPAFDTAFEPGFADRHVLQFDAQLQARQFQVPMQFDGIIGRPAPLAGQRPDTRVGSEKAL